MSASLSNFTVLAILLVLAAASAPAAASDAERGKSIATVCMACHGEDGNSSVGACPNIAGQSASYFAKQMRDMKSGMRNPGAMVGIADSFSDADFDDLGAYYATQSLKGGAAGADLAELGEQIYLAGIKRKGVAACAGCHSPSGNGNDAASFPSLRGQWPEYTVAQLKAFRSGQRGNPAARATRMMLDVAMDLSDEEIEAVASYVRGLR